LKFSDLYEQHDLPAELAREEGISMALESMRRAYANDPIRERILAQEKAERDEQSRLRAAQEQGQAEGRAEVAKKMLSAGIDHTTIQACTGLSLEEIEALDTPLG
jgi:predicted transposase/invertase (TIGR01784 family)